MKNESIFDKKWIDLVFEGKNQEYGAYKLRQENPKISILAFLFGLFFIVTVSGLAMLMSSFNTKPIVNPIPEIPTVVVVSNIFPPTNVIPKVTPVIKRENIKEIKKEDLINPKIVKANEHPDDFNKNIDLNKKTIPDNNSGNQTGAVISSNGGESKGTIINIEKPKDNNPVVAAILDKQPEFPGGINKFYEYVGIKFEKPEIDIEKTVNVYVSFIVEKDGSMSNIKVLKDPGYGLATEAIRVLSSLKTKWKPGVLNGEFVRTSYNLPIAVKME